MSDTRPSSSLSRPSFSLSQRPPSSRPPSSASQRPPSNASTTRPRSRPASASSGRPQSRFSQRTHSRHAKSRINPFSQTIVTQLTGLKEDQDPEAYKRNVDYVVRTLESATLSKGPASVDMAIVEQQINGHALKARIMMKDVLSEALLVAFKTLMTHISAREKDLDHDVQTTHIPDHLQLLLSLSQPPSTTTLAYANQFLDRIKNPPPPTPTLTWKDILAEEPFEGEHWEGILDNTSREGQDWESTPTLSPLSSNDEVDSISSLSHDGYDSHSRSRHRGAVPSSEDEEEGEPLPAIGRRPASSDVPPHTYAHRKYFEELQAMQYWRTDWKGYIQPSKQFDIGDPSTLGSAFVDVLAHEGGDFAATQALLQRENYIREEDMVRELYMALQGRRNVVLTWKSNAYITTSETPRLAHLTLASQASMLSSFAETATTLEHLRHFRSSVFALSCTRSHATRDYKENSTPSRNITQTVEAFADAIDTEIRAFDTWCADQEASFCSIHTSQTSDPDITISLLHTSKALQDTFELTFPVLLNIIREIFSDDLSHSSEYCVSYLTSGRRAPAMVASRLLDLLFGSVQVHLERAERVTSDSLMRVFVKSAEPVWGMCGRWLRDGMGLSIGSKGVGRADELDDEFFIESKVVGFGDALAEVLHPEFWQEAYGLREGVSPGGLDQEDQQDGTHNGSVDKQKAVPTFLEHVAEMILRTGKAVGLIRALGSTINLDGDGSWEVFGQLLITQDSRRVDEKSGKLFSVSVDTLSSLIHDRLLSRCQAVGKSLTRILVEDCGVWKHLESIEDLFLMRRGDAMSHFIDVIFNKMDSKQAWSDFHFLNTAFTDVVEASINAGARDWILPSLVRFSYRGGKEKERRICRTVKSIDGLSVEYAVPFPLTYLFRPNVVGLYSEVFVFLLQIKRAKGVLEKILVRGDEKRRSGEGMKIFYVMRSRLSWFINTLLNFFTTYVIHVQVIGFHKKIREAQSLDEMIHLHDEHLNKIQGRCLLKTNTSALHQAILSTLDMSLQFSEFFVAFAGDTATHEVSRYSVIKRHRSRRPRRKRRNIIGFSQPSADDSVSSSSSDENDDDEDLKPTTVTLETESYSTMNVSSMLTSPEEFAERMDKFSTELDGLVKFIRRGVESLAGGTSEAAPAFGVLAFALEDWGS